ncbi:hypothetical protein ACFFLM_01480 [Deinococcus oregonensis]|uniref:DUF11 domain-containing protein n=1 Tax=Deinococcus oregonensis TaxID=1805970 RepID=A0ABV6AT25_9DEIO
MTNFSERFAHLGRTLGRSLAVLALAFPLLGGGASAQTTNITDLEVYETVDLSNSPLPSQGKFYVNQIVNYTLKVSNYGPRAANGAVLSEVVEPGLAPLGWNCTATGGAVCPAPSGTGFPNFVIPILPSGGKLTVTYSGKVTGEDGQLSSTSTITPPAGVTDSNPVNNTDTVYICAAAPQLTISKTSNGSWVALQPGAFYTLTVKNLSKFADSAGLITLKDQLPAGIGIASASGFSPAPGWTCTYSGEAEQGRGGGLIPFEGQLLTCTTNNILPLGGSVVLTIPVNVTPLAGASVTNYASVGGGGDPDPLPDPTTCTPVALGSGAAEQCAQNTTLVTPRLVPPTPTCLTGAPVNLLQTALDDYAYLDSVTTDYPAKLIPNAASYTVPATVSGSGFVVEGIYSFNNGYAVYNAFSLPTTLQLVVNGTVYATFLTEAGYSGRASVTTQNGATLFDGTTSVQLNRISKTNLWVRLPASVTSITTLKITFKSSSPGTESSDDYGFNVTTIWGCVPAAPAATVSKTVQNITAGGPVGTTGTGKPGEVLEYCITTTNTGNIGLGNLVFGDNVPANTTFKLGAYGVGQDIRVTYPTGGTPTGNVFLTAAADADKGVLAAGRVTVNPSTFILAPGKTYTVCFRATIS